MTPFCHPDMHVTGNSTDLSYCCKIGLMRRATVRDLYPRVRDLANFTGSYTGSIPVHGVLALRMTSLRCARCATHYASHVNVH